MRRLLVAAVLFLFTGIANAAVIILTASLTGPAESPPNASPGTGFARVTYDTDAHSMRVEALFQDLLAPTTAAHIHCCTPTPLTGTAAVATQTPSFIGFPLGVTSGVFDNTYDMTLASSYRAGFITDNGGTPGSAEAALLAGLQSGRAYFNIHTSTFPAGEIRGFLVPEPGTLALLGLAFAGLALRRRVTH